MDPATSTLDPPVNKTAAGRDVAVDYLRSTVTLFVVLHHAALAYTSFSRFEPSHYMASTAPVVDSVRWPLLDFIVGYNDSFFMSLMFLISGLFVLPSIRRKGKGRFVRERLRRLGIPFWVGAITVVPLAYWPSYRMAIPRSGYPYWISIFTTDGWPAGPGWFLWVLLVFVGLAALSSRLLERLSASRESVSVPVFISVITASYLAVIPWGPVEGWISLGGPLDVQGSRILLYGACFMVGAVWGGCERKPYTAGSGHPAVYVAAGMILFAVYVWMLIHPDGTGLPAAIYPYVRAGIFAVSCACSILGFFGLFQQYVRRRSAWMDNLTTHAYGIYVVHYVFVTWIQYALLPVSWPGWFKFAIVFPCSTLLSWGTVAALRKIPAFRDVL